MIHTSGGVVSILFRIFGALRIYQEYLWQIPKPTG